MHTDVQCTPVCNLTHCTPLCNDGSVDAQPAPARSLDDTRKRILNVALETLGQNPDAGMGEIATAAGVVRRTVYGYFPTRTELIRTLAQQAAQEVVSVLDEVNEAGRAADTVWVDFVARLWPLARRYRVLLTLRRGEYGEDIHALLRPVDETLADLAQRGQDSGVFGRHLPARVVSQVAFAAVFTIADSNLAGDGLSVGAAVTTSLLILGVAEARVTELVKFQQ